jgi:hypothetical protein
MNQAMAQKLKIGVALNVLIEGKEVKPGLYQLKRFIEGVDYCDPTKDRWIWSIGRNVFDGQIFASSDARFYEDPNWECLYLR